MRYSASKYSVTLKTGLGVVQGHWKWRCSIDHIQLSISPPCKYNSTVFELFGIEWYHDLEIWVRGHSRSFKPVPFESLGAVSYSPFIALSCIICEIKRKNIGQQEAQLSQRDRAMLHVIEYFAKFLRYSASKNGVTSKLSVGVVQ